MQLKKVENIRKKDSFLYYRTVYNANITIEYGNLAKEEKGEAEIVVEKTALGEIKINVSIETPINYPMAPVLKLLKEYATKIYEEGLLT